MRKIALVIAVIGILAGVCPLAGQLYTGYRGEMMIKEWLGATDAQVAGPAGGMAREDGEASPEEAYSMLQEAFKPESAGGDGGDEEMPDAPRENAPAGTVEGNDAAKTEKASSGQVVLGVIQIKKIKVKAPIVEGIKESNLRSGIGHIPGTANPGQPGNCALAGHRSYTFGKFFNRLDELEAGDEIIIMTKKEDLVYRVFKISTVEPDDTSVLKGSADDNFITLITCTPVFIASHRLIVNAALEKRVPREP